MRVVGDESSSAMRLRGGFRLSVDRVPSTVDSRRMSSDVPLRCRCGRIRGLAVGIGPEMGTRLVCYCDDCQRYARTLATDGVLDVYGGTDIFQTTPAHVRITAGTSELRCLRLSDKGLMRWYSGCCKVPVANTVASPKVPFVGIVHTFMDHVGDGHTRDEVLGPPRAFVQGRFAPGGVPPLAHPSAPLSLIVRAMRVMLLGWVRREHRPSPFFDVTTGKPIVVPSVLPREKAETAARPRRG